MAVSAHTDQTYSLGRDVLTCPSTGGQLITFICNKTCLVAGFVPSRVNVFLLLDSPQRSSHSEYILHSSVPMGSHVHAKLVVIHTKKELVYAHLLLRVPGASLFTIGNETWPLAKVPEVAHVLSFYIKEVEIELIFALRESVSEVLSDFQNCHVFGHKIWNLRKVPEVAYGLSFYPGGSKLSLFHSTGSSFQDIGRFSKSPYLGMSLAVGKSFRSCTCSLFLSREVHL